MVRVRTLNAYHALPSGKSLKAIDCARAGKIFLDEKFVEPVESGNDFLVQRGRRFLPQPGALGFGNLRRKFLERFQQRVLRGILLGLILHLLRHVAQRDARFGDAVFETEVQQHDRLIDQLRQRIQPRNHVVVILNRAMRSHDQRFGGVLLDAAHLMDRQILALEPRAFDPVLDSLPEQIVIQLIGRSERGAIDGVEHLQRRLQFTAAARDGFERFIRPAIVQPRITDVGGPFGILVHRVIPVQFEQFIQPLAIRPCVGGELVAVAFVTGLRLTGNGEQNRQRNKPERQPSNRDHGREIS